MSKCKISIGGIRLIMDTKEAMKVFELLNDAEIEKLDYDYISSGDSPTGKSQTLYYVKPFDDGVTLENVAQESYAMWKLYTSTKENAS